MQHKVSSRRGMRPGGHRLKRVFCPAHPSRPSIPHPSATGVSREGARQLHSTTYSLLRPPFLTRVFVDHAAITHKGQPFKDLAALF